MPKPYSWGPTSTAHLETCHPLLITLFRRVIKRTDLPHDMSIICGHRGKAAQDAAFASGNSRVRWPRGKHNKLPSQAVDVVPFINDKQEHRNADVFRKHVPMVKDEWAKMVAEGLVPEGVTLESGADWGWDFPHWEVRGV